jgi:polyisoprenyl-teichoic acid--peptidoglycan teichoic acid transferase
VERTRERRARYRNRWLMVAAVLVGLSLGIGAYTGTFLLGGSGSASGYPAARAGEARSVSASANGSPESTAPSVENAADEPAPAQTVKPAEDSLYMLVLGVDRRPSEAGGAPSRSDTIMLAQVSPGSGRVQLLSVPRDLLVEVKPGVEDRINTAYAYGGVEQAAAAVENLTGISADRYAIVDFGGFEEAIDALGGVTVEVDEPIRLGIEGRRVYVPAGRQELDGLEALAYARYRGTACGDLGRIKRQQRLVAALRQQALGWDTITRLPGIVRVAHANVDTNLGIAQAISLGRALAGRDGEGGMKSFQLEGNPETLPNGDAVLVPDEAANAEVLEDFRDASPPSPEQDRAPRNDGPSSEC